MVGISAWRKLIYSLIWQSVMLRPGKLRFLIGVKNPLPIRPTATARKHSLGVTTAIMGNCGFGIVPAPPPLRDMIMRNLAVVEGMDLDALRTGINWQFQSFAEYMTMLRGRGAYMNVGVLVGHSAVRTAVMGEDASMRKEPTAAELAEMSRLVAEAMVEGAIGTGASYSLNHSGLGGVPMPSTISDVSEFDALVGAMGGPGRGVVEISSGQGGRQSAACDVFRRP